MERLRAFVVAAAVVGASATTVVAAADRFRPVDVFDETLREVWPPGSSPSGSGFSVGPGRVVTAAHVVAGCRVMWVRTSSLRPTAAKLLAIDTRADVALLSVPGLTDPRRTVAAVARPGERLVLRGFPQKKGKVAVSPTETGAIQTGETEDSLGGPVLEMAGRGPEGFSGSAVTNTAGHVVGMVVARRHGAEDRILAIPADRIRLFLTYMGVDWRESPPLAAPPLAGPPAAEPSETGPSEAEATPRSAPGLPPGPAPIETFQVGCSR
ncbi:MAG: trypsin-like peptidase domain-containing protein [Phyllobacteriaceae bacterium]|nr:trypsin-like peptidase domain-containing protein [Phyllobacteriaceae bacterium]